MPRSLPTPLHIARQILMSNQAWLFFVECPTSNGGYFRLVRSQRAVTADGKVWQPASIEIELPAEEGEGALGQLKISVPNISRLPIAYVELQSESGDGEILGRRISCWLQHESHLEEFEANLMWQHFALAVDADERILAVECGHPAAAQRVPGPVFTRARFPQLLARGL